MDSSAEKPALKLSVTLELVGPPSPREKALLDALRAYLEPEPDLGYVTGQLFIVG